MPHLPIRCLSKPRPRVTERATFMPPAYTAWKRNIRTLLTALHPPCYTTPCALTLHIALTPKGGHPPDIDNLAGGFMDAANTILYSDDAHVTLLGAYKARNTQDSISFNALPLTAQNIPAIRTAWIAILEAAIADIPPTP